MKRKYAKDVSPIRYTEKCKDDEFCYWTSEIRGNCSSMNGIVPVRIIRESFYRRLIKIYEQYLES